MSDTMYALVKTEAGPGLSLERIPIPETGPNDVKIKIHKTAICGTDCHIYNWDEWAQRVIKVPLNAGHEYVGEIVEVGSMVDNFDIGDIVSGEGHIVCGKCRNCRAGKRVFVKILWVSVSTERSICGVSGYTVSTQCKYCPVFLRRSRQFSILWGTLCTPLYSLIWWVKMF